VPPSSIIGNDIQLEEQKIVNLIGANLAHKNYLTFILSKKWMAKSERASLRMDFWIRRTLQPAFLIWNVRQDKTIS